MNSRKLIRTGIGYDVHSLSEGVKLVIGGVEIDFSKGSVGHSDGDALIHSIVDAIFGAACIGDLGQYFPSNESKWKDVSSIVFLKFAVEKIRLMGYEINNVDTNVIIQNPKILDYKSKIINNLSQTMKINKNQISIKAKTTDFLGFIGNGEGWSSQAIVTIYKK